MEVHASAGDSFLGGEDFTSALATAFLEHAGVKEEATRARREEPALEAGRAREAAAHERGPGRDPADPRGSRDRLAGVAEPARGAHKGARGADAASRRARHARRPAEGLRPRRSGSRRRRHADAAGARARGEALRPLPAHHDPPGRGDRSRSGDPGRPQVPRQGPVRGRPHGHLARTRWEWVSRSPTSAASRSGREFSPIIERNTVIPASREHSYSPMHDHQREVHFEIYQGESRRLENNVKLGSLTLPLPPGRAREHQLLVRFTYDINGLLEVDTKVAGTDVRRRLVIEGNPGFLPPEEIQKRLFQLQALKIHPRDQMENRTVLARGERIYEESLGDRRLLVGRLMAQFDAVLARQEPARDRQGPPGARPRARRARARARVVNPDPWRVLGIAPTSDIRLLKKAYAARLKHTNPEDDAEGFQRLREAYEMALSFIRWQEAERDQAGRPRPSPPQLGTPDAGPSRTVSRRSTPSGRGKPRACCSPGRAARRRPGAAHLGSRLECAARQRILVERRHPAALRAFADGVAAPPFVRAHARHLVPARGRVPLDRAGPVALPMAAARGRGPPPGAPGAGAARARGRALQPGTLAEARALLEPIASGAKGGGERASARRGACSPAAPRTRLRHRCWPRSNVCARTMRPGEAPRGGARSWITKR